MGETATAFSATDVFGLFVSSVEGSPCTRFGTKTLIGAERDPDNAKKIRYRTKEIVAIPRAEADRYAREYARLISDEALVVHTADEWSEQQRQVREVGAPREKLAKDRTSHADFEGSRK